MINLPVRLIDANAFFENLTEYAPPEMVWDAGDIAHKLAEMPTIDAVQVVRCKDCVLWKRIDAIRGKCPFLIGEQQCTGPNHYCSLGERRDNDGKNAGRG